MPIPRRPLPEAPGLKRSPTQNDATLLHKASQVCGGRVTTHVFRCPWSQAHPHPKNTPPLFRKHEPTPGAGWGPAPPPPKIGRPYYTSTRVLYRPGNTNLSAGPRPLQGPPFTRLFVVDPLWIQPTQ